MAKTVLIDSWLDNANTQLMADFQTGLWPGITEVRDITHQPTATLPPSPGNAVVLQIISNEETADLLNSDHDYMVLSYE